MSASNRSERYRKGLKQLQEQFGQHRADNMIHELTAAYEFFAEVNVEFPFGDLYPRKDIIDSKTREMVTISALTVQGSSLRELRLHIIAALRLGVTREQVCEIITQMIAYCGFPATTNALLTAKKLFDELDAKQEIL